MLKNNIKKIIPLIYEKGQQPEVEHGENGIKQVGHRHYVGGVGKLWYTIGQLQFDFLINNGLKPDDILLDIACGSLRAGRLLIPYLDKGNYLGIDKESVLIEKGITNEMNQKVLVSKAPEFVVSSNFEFTKFSKQANFAIAQSLFTHLPSSDINYCFKQLNNYIAPKGIFYATFFVVEKPVQNPQKAHDHKMFRYTYSEIQNFGLKNNWQFDFIRDWNHPRNQQIVKYTKQ